MIKWQYVYSFLHYMRNGITHRTVNIICPLPKSNIFAASPVTQYHGSSNIELLILAQLVPVGDPISWATDWDWLIIIYIRALDYRKLVQILNYRYGRHSNELVSITIFFLAFDLFVGWTPKSTTEVWVDSSTMTINIPMPICGCSLSKECPIYVSSAWKPFFLGRKYATTMAKTSTFHGVFRLVALETKKYPFCSMKDRFREDRFVVLIIWTSVDMPMKLRKLMRLIIKLSRRKSN